MVPDGPIIWLRPDSVGSVVLLGLCYMSFGPNSLGPGAWPLTAQRHPLASIKSPVSPATEYKSNRIALISQGGIQLVDDCYINLHHKVIPFIVLPKHIGDQ